MSKLPPVAELGLDFQNRSVPHRSRRPNAAGPFRPPLSSAPQTQLPKHIEAVNSARNNDSLREVPWSEVFERCLDVKIAESSSSFRVYCSGSVGPLCVLIHGAGETSMTWGPLMRGFSAKCRVIAIDLRGHGHSHSDDEDDLSIGKLVSDVKNVVQHFMTTMKGDTELDSTPPILIGHSLGGAVAIRIALDDSFDVSALVVIDMVEGTIISNLDFMRAFVDSRPSQFTSIKEAISWSLRSGIRKSRSGACMSIPDQLISTSDSCFIWRTQLKESFPHWVDWFAEMSSHFLKPSIPKLLIVPNIDRLDTSLTVAHMQGKYQLKVIQGAGHFVQEEQPNDVNSTIVDFLRHFSIGN